MEEESGGRCAEQQPPLKKGRALPPLPSKKRPRDIDDDKVDEHLPAPLATSSIHSQGLNGRIDPHIATSDAAASSSASTDTNAAPSRCVSSHSDRFGTFFTSTWNTSFLLTVAQHEPWRGSEVYAEIPNHGSQPLDSSVTSIPIDPPSGHELVRIDGPMPLWFHSKPAKIETSLVKLETATTEGSLSPSASTPVETAGMPPPPEETYASGELAVASAQQFALEHGYKLIISSSVVFGAQKHRRWYLRCHESVKRGTKVQESSTGTGGDECEGSDGLDEAGGSQTSAQTRCKFAIAVRPLNGRWKLDVTHAEHEGHGKDADLLVTAAKKLTQGEKLVIDRLCAQNTRVEPAKIFEALNQKRKELDKLPLVSRDPIIQYTHHSRTQRKTPSAQAKATTADGPSPPQSLLTKRLRFSSPPQSSHHSSSAPLEDYCTQDFRVSLSQHLGGALLRLPQDHETRISAAAQVYLSSTLMARRDGKVKRDDDDNGRSSSSSMSTNFHSGDSVRGEVVPRRMRCKLCQQLGHNRRTCPQRFEASDEEEAPQPQLNDIDGRAGAI